jgi:asparagine synthase (glutamine-hydrolysing)
MCGIAGMAGIADERLLRAMLEITRHRGPDDSGIYAVHGPSAGGRVAIGNNRLSILDLSPAGHQPMSNEDGTIRVVFNGEIFNFPELRKELVNDGHQFRSHTDTEILVHLYEKCGTEMVKRLNGMFAFAIWDAPRQELLIFRDRTGIKPLYYAQVDDRLYFASEIKALTVCPEITVDLDMGSLCQYLTYAYVPSPSSLFKGVRKLPAGSFLVWRKGQIQIESYWDFSYGNYFRDSEKELAKNLQDLLIATTKRQLISDVPVGFFLSGGLDSSALVACAAQQQGIQLNCYSIAYKQEHGRFEQNAKDPHYASLVARQFGANFHQITVEPDVVNLLPKVIWQMDDPISDPSAISAFLICQAAASRVKVLISGQGADEVFGGYRVHRVHRSRSLLQLIPKALREGTAPKILSWVGRNKGKFLGIPPGLILAFSRFGNQILRSSGMALDEQFAALRSYYTDADLRRLLSSESNFAARDFRCHATLLNIIHKMDGQDPLNQFLYVDGKTFLADLNLGVTDKMSMACSVEVRVPFLDNEVLDFAGRLPPEMKIKGMNQKYILRKAMHGLLPKPVLQRRKAAFGLPIRAWLRNELREMLGDMLSEERTRRRGLFDPAGVTRLLKQNDIGECDNSLHLWALLSLELWHQAFVDQKRVSAAEAAVVA